MKKYTKMKFVAAAGMFLLVAGWVSATTISLDTTSISGSSSVTFDSSESTMVVNSSSYNDIADWVFYGAGDGNTRIEKASVDYIGSLTNINLSVSPGGFYQTWTGGTPTASGTNSRNEVYQGVGSSVGAQTSMTYTLTMPSTSGHIYLAMSNYYADADMTVTVNGSNQTFYDIFGSTSGSVSRLFDISISDVDADDEVTILLNNYATASDWANLVPWSAAVTGVPEPMTVSLILAGGVLFVSRRRKKQ